MRLKIKLTIQQILDFWAAVPADDDAKRHHVVMSLNETAKDIVEILNNGETTEDEIVSKLLQEYDVTEEELRPHVQSVIQNLRDEHLLVE